VLRMNNKNFIFVTKLKSFLRNLLVEMLSSSVLGGLIARVDEWTFFPIL